MRPMDSEPALPSATQAVARAVVVAASKLGVVFDVHGQRTVALDAIDLEVRQGDCVSLIGPSGCGKTTVLRAVADLEQPTEGSLLVNGLAPDAARRARAYGYVFQAPALYPWRSVERNVMLPLEIMGVPRAERRRRAAHYLDMVGLAGFSRRFPWQLSGGMQQRASIARALSFEPALLLMDEPFGALDEITRDGLNRHLHALWHRTALTALFVTHSIPEAVYLSTRIVVMSPRPGRIVDVIDCNLPEAADGLRDLAVRESPEFIAVARRVRDALRQGHSYE